MAERFVFYNNFRAKLVGPLTDSATTAELDDVGPLVSPSSNRLFLTLADPMDPTNTEIIRVTGISGTTLTITRAQEGTTAQEWPDETPVSQRFTARMAATFGAGIDNGGDAPAFTAVNLQPGRTAADEVAKGNHSVTVGHSTKATAGGSIAIGRKAYATAYSQFADDPVLGELGFDLGYATAIGGGALASGLYSSAIGPAAQATGAYALAHGHDTRAPASATAVGREAKVWVGSDDLPLWAASTSYSSAFVGGTTGSGLTTSTPGSVVRFAGGGVGVCLHGGTSGATEPTAFDGNDLAVDGTVVWVQSFPTANRAAAAVGALAQARGRNALAAGNNARATGDGATAVGQARAAATYATAVGDEATAEGASATALGAAARAAGPRTIAINANARTVSPDRRVQGHNTVMGSEARPAMGFPYAGHIAALDHVGLQEGSLLLTSETGHVRRTVQRSTREMTFYTIPVQAGDQGWQAEHLYEHGRSIVTPDGFARCTYQTFSAMPNGWYFDKYLSGATEPTWGTTVGGIHNDGSDNLRWIGFPRNEVLLRVPEYARFTPTRVGIIVHRYVPGASPVMPTLEFGVDGALDKWLGSVTPTKITASGCSEWFEPSNTEWARLFGGGVATGGTDMDLVLQFVFQGYVVETMDP